MNGPLGLQPWDLWEIDEILESFRKKDEERQDDEFSELTDEEFVLVHIR